MVSGTRRGPWREPRRALPARFMTAAGRGTGVPGRGWRPAAGWLAAAGGGAGTVAAGLV
jgi:hypothetical protein